MLTKRAAIIAIYANVLAKLARADEPSKLQDATISLPSFPSLSTHTTGAFAVVNEPRTWHVNLDGMKDLKVWYKGGVITITADELFAALKQ